MSTTNDASVEELRILVERLRNEVDQIKHSRAAVAAGRGHSPSHGRMSRAGLLKIAGISAVSAAAAGLELGRAPGTASAADDASATLGEINLAEHRTAVKYDGASNFSGVVLLGNDSTLSGASGVSFPAAVGGFAGAGATVGAGGIANGVYGYTDNGDGYGVVGHNSNNVVGGGAGVYGVASSAAGYAICGNNSNGTAVYGGSASEAASATALVGELTTSTPGSNSSAVRGIANGTNGLGIGVYGSAKGGGSGGYFTSVNGNAVVATSTSNTGVYVSGATGIAVSGTVIGVEASGPTAVQAAGSALGVSGTSSSGRGGQFQGAAANISLVPGPAPSHPKGGRAGDLYVDSKKRMWFCIKSGSTATWKQVQVR